MRLVTRVTASVIPLFLAGGLILAWFTGRAVRRELIEEVELRGRSSLREAAAREGLEKALLERDERRLLPFLQALRQSAHGLYAMALSPEGDVLAHTDVARKGSRYPIAPKRLTEAGGFPALETMLPVLRRRGTGEEFLLGPGEPERIGWLGVAMDLSPAEQTEVRILRSVGAIIAWTGALLLAACWLSLRGTLRPIRELSAGTARISRGEYLDVPVTTKDELGELARSFNRMSGTLSRTTVSKAYLDAVLENMLDPLIVLRADGTIRTANPAARRLLGELTGRPAEMIACEAERERFRDGPLARLLAGESMPSFELGLAGLRGRVPALFGGSPLRGPDGASSGVICVAKDVSELKGVQAELARSNAELERFAYAASHDLQEPLRKVSGYTQLLAMRWQGKLDAESDQYIASVVKGVARMQRLIRDMLRYSRVGQDRAPVEPVDAGQVLREVLADLGDMVKEKGARVTSDPLPTVAADPTEMRQLLQNLVDNAIKFCRPGDCRVHVSARPVDGQWEFSVSDNGIGVDPRYADQIFVMFKRLHSQAEYPGTGIGLAICKKIVERHGGRIWTSPTPGGGSTFRFTLPAAPAGAPAAPSKEGA